MTKTSIYHVAALVYGVMSYVTLVVLALFSGSGASLAFVVAAVATTYLYQLLVLDHVNGELDTPPAAGLVFVPIGLGMVSFLLSILEIWS